jgi:hypothetical protein
MIDAPAPTSAPSASPTFPPLNLVYNAQLPDPFTMYNGFKITTQSQWQSRRAELKDAFLYYMYGHMPPSSPVSVVSIDPDVVIGPIIKRTVHLKTGPGRALPFSINLHIPASGTSPFPILVGSNMSWSPLADNCKHASIGVANLQTLVSRGYIMAEFGCDDFSLDYADDGGAAVFNSRVYPLYPGYDWGNVAAWAWGFSRVVDYLETLGYVDTTKIAIAGHSRGAKSAMLAAALDERIALVGANQPGMMGSTPERMAIPGGESIDTVLASLSGWFCPNLKTFAGSKVNHLPFDQHELIGLIAPRAYLGTIALQWNYWEGNVPTAEAHIAGQQIYTALGVPKNAGLFVGNTEHQMSYMYWKAIVDFADEVFYGKTPSPYYDFSGVPISGLTTPYNWSTPTLK